MEDVSRTPRRPQTTGGHFGLKQHKLVLRHGYFHVCRSRIPYLSFPYRILSCTPSCSWFHHRGRRFPDWSLHNPFPIFSASLTKPDREGTTSCTVQDVASSTSTEWSRHGKGRTRYGHRVQPRLYCVITFHQACYACRCKSHLIPLCISHAQLHSLPYIARLFADTHFVYTSALARQ